MTKNPRGFVSIVDSPYKGTLGAGGRYLYSKGQFVLKKPNKDREVVPL